MKTPSVKNYYSALQEQFRLQSAVLTDVLPHAGERGRNNEERFKEFLGRILPKRYSIGTGFIICSEPDIPPSSQTDVVLFDEFLNSPIHREIASHVYPVEMVYGTVEVKGRLKKSDLSKIFADISKIRGLGKHRYYLDYGSTPKSNSKSNKSVVGKFEKKITLPPRAFVFAYEQQSWSSLDDFVGSLKEAWHESSCHIHGFAILNDDWYVSQEAHADDPPQFHQQEGDALLNFVNGMFHSIGSNYMGQMSIDRYYRGDA